MVDNMIVGSLLAMVNDLMDFGVTIPRESMFESLGNSNMFKYLRFYSLVTS